MEQNLSTSVPDLSACHFEETTEASENYLLPLIDHGVVSETLFRLVIERLSPLSLFVCLLGAVGGIFNVTVYIKQRRDAYAVYLLGLCFGDLVYVAVLSVLFASGITRQTTTLFHQVHCRQRRDAYSIYLLGMSCCECFYGLSKFLFYLSVMTLDSASRSHKVIDTYLNGYVCETMKAAAVSLNCLVSLQRLLVIAFPLRIATRVDKPSTAIAVVCLVTTSSMALSWYIFTAYDIVPSSHSTWIVVPSHFSAQHGDVITTFKSIKRVAYGLLPTGLSVVFNAGLVVSLFWHITANGLPKTRKCISSDLARSVNADRSTVVTEHYSSRQTKRVDHLSITKMIVSLTFAFFVMNAPQYANSLAGSHLPHYGTYKRENNLYVIVSMTFEQLMNACQLVVYLVNIAFSRHFRANFRTCRFVSVALNITSRLSVKSSR